MNFFKPIIEHQNELKELNKKLLFLRDNFDLAHQDTFFDELNVLIKELKEELDYHFNLQIQTFGENNKVKFLVNENRLIRDMLFRMLDFIKAKSTEKNLDAFLKIDDVDEILRAYLKKEKGLFIQQLRDILDEKEIKEIEEKLKKLI